MLTIAQYGLSFKLENGFIYSLVFILFGKKVMPLL